MGETTETSWKAGLCLLIVLVAIFLVGSKMSRGDTEKPITHNLVCQSYGDRFECRER